jgi:hypothetical protein
VLIQLNQANQLSVAGTRRTPLTGSMPLPGRLWLLIYYVCCQRNSAHQYPLFSISRRLKCRTRGDRPQPAAALPQPASIALFYKAFSHVVVAWVSLPWVAGAVRAYTDVGTAALSGVLLCGVAIQVERRQKLPPPPLSPLSLSRSLSVCVILLPFALCKGDC